MYFYAQYNQLSGVLPGSLGKLKHMSYISFTMNQLSGAVPATFCNYQATTVIMVDHNVGLTCYPQCLAKYSHFTRDNDPQSIASDRKVLCCCSGCSYVEVTNWEREMCPPTWPSQLPTTRPKRWGPILEPPKELTLVTRRQQASGPAPTCIDIPGTLFMCPQPFSQKFLYTGSPQTYVVPNDCGLPPTTDAEGATIEPEARERCIFQIDACGGQGKSYGGRGGFISSMIEAEPGQTLYVYVGGYGQTFNGGGSGACKRASDVNCIRGGGGTDIRSGSELDTRLVVAGGGGAGGNCDPKCPGGNGGGAQGKQGANPRQRPKGQNFNGKGGTQVKGGACSNGFTFTGLEAPCHGRLGQGGTSAQAGVGGAGGGGYYGGGAGILTGGGGSSWSSGTILQNVQGDGRCQGNGVLYMTPLELKELPPTLEPTEGPTDPTMEPSKPTYWPTHTPRPSKPPRLRHKDKSSNPK